MVEKNSNDTWATLTHEEKNRLLYQRQKELLDTFLEKKAISKEQHDKSLRDLTEMMGMSNAGSI